MSEPDSEQRRTDLWAAQHTDLTGHRAYREITTTPLVAHPAPTNPLHERETARRDA